MIKIVGIFLLLLTLLICGRNLAAQDLEGIGKQDPVKVSGAFATGAGFYHASGISRRYDPYVWTTSARINLNLYGVSLPFSFLYSTQNSVIRQPFNRFGLTPRYKWVKAYLGYAAMDFSPFTFGGNAILGAGAELNPGKLRFAAVYGRLRKAVARNFDASYTIPVYKRMGYGVKVGYGDENNFVDVIIFRSYDDPASIAAGDSLGTAPQDNLVLGVNSRYSLTKRLSVRFEVATSAINRNREAERTDLSSRTLFSHAGGLFRPTVTSEFYNALQGGISYRLDAVDFDVRYQRIDPGYETLSTYFFNNDREELAFTTGVRLMKNRLMVRAGIGQLRNNLAGDESTSMTRVAGNAQVNYTPNERLNFSVYYTNFSSMVEYLADELQTDLPDYLQVSETIGLNAIYSIRKDGKTHSILLNGNYQGQNTDSEGDNAALNNTALYNINSRYTINFAARRLRLHAGLNYNESNVPAGGSRRYGVTSGLSKMLPGNKLQLNLTTGGYQVYTNSVHANFTTNSRLTALYRLDEHHSVDTSMSLLSRQNRSEASATASFSEYRAQINYRYQF